MLVSDPTKSGAAEMKDTGTKANTRHAYTNKVLDTTWVQRLLWRLDSQHGKHIAVGSTWDSIKGMSISPWGSRAQ